ncbi:MAG: TauD/TfdA family dioxygenase [Alphaproteobacteria bacterium]|nr:TauD/TfdA family dioxygenase [Alphaproteobacteria bacterium]
MDAQQMMVMPVSGAVGAEVRGIDISRPLPAVTVATLRAALGEHGVLFFRDQALTEAQHIAFAEQFAKININRFFRAVEGWPQIAEVRKEPEQTKNIGGGWHTDHSYDQIPALGSLLYAREVPPSGGDTIFASMFAAYDALSDGLKRTLEGLRAVHSSRHVFGTQAKRGDDLKDRLGNAEAATQDAVHPMVITHPISGKKALYVNRGFTTHIEGWTVEESKPLLEYLYQHGARPEFSCRFNWAPGSMAFWDNRATWHLAVNDYQGHRRLMHRITLEGVAIS